MPRRTFRYNKETGEMDEVTGDIRPLSVQSSDGLLWGDRSYEGLRATDGTDISSRSKHREYMRTHGLTTIDDFKDTFAQAEKRRDAYRTQGIGGATRAEDVARAIHELESKRK